MLPSELDTSGIVNNDYKDVVFGRRSVKTLDANYKIEREEILQIIQEALASTPSAVDTQPFHFLVIESDEAKEKVDKIMWTPDKDRTNRCSFAIIPFADAQWFEHFDEHVARGEVESPGFWTPEVKAMMIPTVATWVDLLCADDASYLHKSVDFQAGLVTMSFLYAVRAHGYDAGFMDAWDPELLDDLFDIDLERFRPQGVIAVGKAVDTVWKLGGSVEEGISSAPEMFRYDAAELTEFV